MATILKDVSQRLALIGAAALLWCFGAFVGVTKRPKEALVGTLQKPKKHKASYSVKQEKLHEITRNLLIR